MIIAERPYLVKENWEDFSQKNDIKVEFWGMRKLDRQSRRRATSRCA